MKHPSFVKTALALGLALLTQNQLQAADHGHLNVGALGTAQDARLFWANGADFSASSGYVKTLEHTNAGKYAGYFQQNITLTALPATAAHAGPDPAAPALGSFIHARFSCEQAPPGGQFAFWESGATAPTLAVAAGEASASTYALSENAGMPGTDPYGHFHGRRFTATKPGLYKISFHAIDASTNGAGGGPIHTPSAGVSVWFQAGVTITEVEPDFEEGHVHLHFGARLGYSWQVEAKDALDPSAIWRPVGSPIIGDDVFIETTVAGDPGEKRFFRVVGTVIQP